MTGVGSQVDIESVLSSLDFRCIGPYRGGRACAAVGHPTDALVFYAGTAGGGVWRTADGGNIWENVSDGYFSSSAVGALAVAESDPNVIFAGTGEACIRNDVASGDGVYRSTDGGATWVNVGLPDTRHIGRIVVHPGDPDVVFVAALGHAWGPSDERGVFRSRDGGASWERVLFGGPEAGAIDLAMDPANPRVVYAALWEAFRTPWAISSGGRGSGLYRSTDGGDAWVQLSSNPGLPGGVWGRVGVAVTAAQPGRVYAMIEAEDGGLHRSDDAGATWERVNGVDGRDRPWYYSHLTADPTDADTVWVMDTQLHKSTDGGRHFVQVATPHGDYHQLWIDPRDPRRMISANDGGATVTFSGGRSWSTIYNQPTAAFYHVAVDTQQPYRVYGTQQDNSAISAPSQTARTCIRLSDCYGVGLAESGHIVVRPDNPNIVYVGASGSASGQGIGNLYRVDHAAEDVGELITIWPENFGGWPPKDGPYRFGWTYPILLSHHNPDILYVAGNQVFRSMDEGRSWQIISPDLTRDDPAMQETSGGPVTPEVSGADIYCTVFALAESPHEPGVLWAGSDDGLVHLTTDGGRTWKDITPPMLPSWATVATIEPCPHDPNTAYVAAYRYKLDDYRPYLYRTSDSGRTWQEITTGIDGNDFTRVVRCDPVRRGLLYAGTESGLYVSADDGRQWHRVSGKDNTNTRLPVVPVYDLAVHEDDLVIATHGRSFWILDDLSVLRQFTTQDANGGMCLYTPRRARQWLTHTLVGAWDDVPSQQGWIGYSKGNGCFPDGAYRELCDVDGTSYRRYLDAGTNPPHGVAVFYWMGTALTGPVSLVFLTADGVEVRRFTSDAVRDHQALPTGPGLHRVLWDFRAHGPTPLNVRAPEPFGGTSVDAPKVPPGDYLAQLTVGETSVTAPVQILADPRVKTSIEDMVEHYRLQCRIRDVRSATREAINLISTLRSQANTWAERTSDAPEVAAAATKLSEALTSIEGELTRTNVPNDVGPVQLNEKLRDLTVTLASVRGAPPRQCYDVFDTLSARVNAQLNRLTQVIDTDVAAFNDLIHRSGVPALAAANHRVAQVEMEGTAVQ